MAEVLKNIFCVLGVEVFELFAKVVSNVANFNIGIKLACRSAKTQDKEHVYIIM